MLPPSRHRSPVIVRLYHEYLQSEDSASFIVAVAGRYTIYTLERLVGTGGRIERRAAVLALGFLARQDSCGTLARALTDRDRGVRFLAENSLRSVWFRDGNDTQQHALRLIVRLNSSGQFIAASWHATRLLDESREIAEAWNQRAISRFHICDYQNSIQDCQETLELNPYHFGAAAGIGQCYLKLDRPEAALDYFQRALTLNPSLEGVRAMVSSLQRSLKDI